MGFLEDRGQCSPSKPSMISWRSGQVSGWVPLEGWAQQGLGEQEGINHRLAVVGQRKRGWPLKTPALAWGSLWGEFV